MTNIGQYFHYLRDFIMHDPFLNDNERQQILAPPKCCSKFSERGFILDNFTLAYLWNIQGLSAFIHWRDSRITLLSFSTNN